MKEVLVVGKVMVVVAAMVMKAIQVDKVSLV